MHIDQSQPHFVRCPKCVEREKARQRAMEESQKVIANQTKVDSQIENTEKDECECC